MLRFPSETGLTAEDVREVVDYMCSIAIHQEIFYLWRPTLRDPGDEMVLELAVAANCEAIVTHNIRDFDRGDSFGVRVITPGQFVAELRGAR